MIIDEGMDCEGMSGKGFWSQRKLRFQKHANSQISVSCIFPIVFKVFEAFKLMSGCYFGRIIFPSYKVTRYEELKFFIPQL